MKHDIDPDTLFGTTMKEYGRFWFRYFGVSVCWALAVGGAIGNIDVIPHGVLGVTAAAGVHQAGLTVVVVRWTKLPRSASPSWSGLLGVTLAMTAVVAGVAALLSLLDALTNGVSCLVAFLVWPVFCFPVWIVTLCEGLGPVAAIVRAARLMRGQYLEVLVATVLIAAYCHVGAGAFGLLTGFSALPPEGWLVFEGSIIASMLAVAAQVTYRTIAAPDDAQVAAVFE